MLTKPLISQMQQGGKNEKAMMGTLGVTLHELEIDMC